MTMQSPILRVLKTAKLFMTTKFDRKHVSHSPTGTYLLLALMVVKFTPFESPWSYKSISAITHPSGA